MPSKMSGSAEYWGWIHRSAVRHLKAAGIFARLLGYLDEHGAEHRVDFLMGFPVEMSFGSFLRNGWDNPTDLSW